MKLRFVLPLFAALAVALAGCGESDDPPDRGPTAGASPNAEGGALVLLSGAMDPGSHMLRAHTCDGEDVSPTLTWGSGPEGTQAFAIVMDDRGAPDGTFTHWLYYNLPGELQMVPGRIEAVDAPPPGGMQGLNDFGAAGYGGPCPPPDEENTYVFRIYALDTPLDLQPGASRDEFDAALEGRVLAEAELVLPYGR